jgi:hypothetical protein
MSCGLLWVSKRAARSSRQRRNDVVMVLLVNVRILDAKDMEYNHLLG